MKLTAGLILRNESANVEACLRSIRPHVDRIVCVDTGSTDNTVELAKKYADHIEVFTGCNDSDGVIQDFSAARNHVLTLIDPDSGFFWCDGDDIVEGAEHLRALCRDPDPTLMYLFPYEYSYDELGNVTTLHWRERLVRPIGSFSWKGPVHEVLMPKDGVHVIAKQVDLVRIKHRREGKTFESTRNLRILEKYVAGEGKGDLRSLFYFGMELKKVGRTAEARAALTEYVAMTGWSDEKCIAQLELATSFLANGELDEAINWGLQAQVTKSWPDPYYFIGYALHALAAKTIDDEQKLYNYRRAAHYLRRGSEMAIAKSGDTVLFSNPTELYQAQLVLCACLATIGDWQGAIESATLGLRGFPGHEGLLEYVQEFTDRRDMTQLSGLLESLASRGRVTPEAKVIIYKALSGEFSVKIKREELPEPACHDGCLRIVFYTGPAYEDWTPKTIRERGNGGSETMCCELAKRLADMGHAVRVFGQPDEEGTYDSVQYLHHDRWGDVSGDVLVCSRIPGAVDSGEFDLRLLWVHDVHCGDELTRARILKFDRVLALSNWHKQNLLNVYPMLDAERVIVTRNGISLDRFKDFAGASDGLESPPQFLPSDAPALIRNPSRAIYSSSPDRGLRLALELWPRIREKVPDAELHVFYGFENWEKSADQWAGHPELCRAALEQVKAGLNQPGVFYHGRVHPKQLAQEFLKSGVWFYPTWFAETSCITAMEAQAAGCRVVTSALAALDETVFDYTGFSKFAFGPLGEYGGEAHREWCIDQTVGAMQYPGHMSAISLCNAQRFSLETLATDWHQMFADLLAEVTAQPVGKYVPWRAA